MYNRSYKKKVEREKVIFGRAWEGGWKVRNALRMRAFQKEAEGMRLLGKNGACMTLLQSLFRTMETWREEGGRPGRGVSACRTAIPAGSRKLLPPISLRRVFILQSTEGAN